MRFGFIILAAVMLISGHAEARRAAPSALGSVPPAPADGGIVAPVGEPLSVTPITGGAPLTVTITGPQKLLDMIAKCERRMGWITPGFSIAWGDGSADPDYSRADQRGTSCADVGRHTYTVPGDYVIKARMFHLGPTDAPVTDWAGETNISVTGTGAEAGAATLTIANVKDGETFYYQAFPRVKWVLQTSAKVDVVTELLARDGSVVESARKDGMAYSGEGDAYLSQTEAAYETALRNNAGPYVLRVRAMQGEQVLAQAEARNLQLSAQMQGNYASWTITPREGIAPLTVKLVYPHFHKDCFSYRIDWGDKSVMAQLTRPIQTGCKLEQGTVELEHTYAKPGKYRIVMRTNNVSPFTKMDDIVPYEAVDISVTR